MSLQTSSSEGVLFYASETYPQYNHVAVSLHNGTVHVSVVFEDRETHSELYTTIGKDLNDGRSVYLGSYGRQSVCYVHGKLFCI